MEWVSLFFQNMQKDLKDIRYSTFNIFKGFALSGFEILVKNRFTFETSISRVEDRGADGSSTALPSTLTVFTEVDSEMKSLRETFFPDKFLELFLILNCKFNTLLRLFSI